MVDRIPLFPDDGTYPGYTDTEPEVLTQEQYQAGPVNYFTQVLGPQTGSLEEETGVGVTKAPEVGQRETREDDPSPQAPSAILAATRPTLGGDISASGKISFDIPTTNPGGAKSYSEYLGNNKMGDRIPLVNIMEGVIDPDKDINLFENLGDAVKAGAKRVKDSPKSIMGTTVQNAFGKNSYRPTGLTGAFADMVHSRQYMDLNAIRAARTAGAADTGFAMTLGNFGITRAPGSGTYTGNMRGMDHETVRALEAISKGYDPTRGRYNMRDPSKSQTVVASGGLQVSSNPMDGFIRANGTVYDPRFIGTVGGASGAYARSDMIRKAATTHGISPAEMSNALARARAGEVTVAEAIRQSKYSKANTFIDNIMAGNYRNEAYEQGIQDIEERGETSIETVYRMADEQREIDERIAADIAESYSDFTEDDFDFGFRQGGRVGLAMGGAPSMASGFVERPPDQVPEDQTVADDKKTQLPEGAFVINAAAAEYMGTDDVRTMLLDAHKEALRRGIVVDKQGNGAKLIDVAISRGEVVVAPHLAKIIGYDRLTKINNRGKPETRERIQENGQQPIGVAEGGEVDYEDRIIADEVRRKMKEMIGNLPEDVTVTSQYYRDQPVARALGKVYSGETVADFQQALADSADMTPLTGRFLSDPVDRRINVPQTPTLFNLFAMAEEIAHLDYPAERRDNPYRDLGSSRSISMGELFDPNAQMQRRYRDYDTKFGANERFDPYEAFEKEERYREELRAKSIAYETVKGLLPKSKKTADYTKLSYEENFAKYIYNTAPTPIRKGLFAKYPELNKFIDDKGRFVSKRIPIMNKGVREFNKRAREIEAQRKK